MDKVWILIQTDRDKDEYKDRIVSVTLSEPDFIPPPIKEVCGCCGVTYRVESYYVFK